MPKIITEKDIFTRLYRGQKLKLLILKKGCHKSDLARFVGIDVRQINRLISGYGRVDLNDLLKFSKFFGVNIQDFILDCNLGIGEMKSQIVDVLVTIKQEFEINRSRSEIELIFLEYEAQKIVEQGSYEYEGQTQT